MTAEAQVNTQQEVPLRPGYLVALATRTRPKHPGAVTVERVEEEPTILPDGRVKRRWQTTRISVDPEEEAEATKVRLRAANRIRAECVKTTFALLLPSDNLGKMQQAVREAFEIIEEFNARSRHFRVGLNTMRGEIMEGGQDTLSALRDLMGDLMEDMRQAVSLGNIQDIRDLATKARECSKMLEPESEAKTAVDSAVNAARRAAREIARRVERGSEQIEDVLSEIDDNPISVARFLFAGVSPSDESFGGQETDSAKRGDLHDSEVPDVSDAAADNAECENQDDQDDQGEHEEGREAFQIPAVSLAALMEDDQEDEE